MVGLLPFAGNYSNDKRYVRSNGMFSFIIKNFNQHCHNQCHNQRQYDVQANLALTGSVAAAASIAMEECSKQFATEVISCDVDVDVDVDVDGTLFERIHHQVFSPQVWNCPVTSFRSRHDERQNNR